MKFDRYSLLNSDPRSLRNIPEIHEAMDNYGPLALLNHVGKYSEGRQAAISAREYPTVPAFRPSNVERGMNGFLDILTVEIYWCQLDLLERSSAYVQFALEQAIEHRWHLTHGKPRTSHKMGYCVIS